MQSPNKNTFTVKFIDTNNEVGIITLLFANFLSWWVAHTIR